MRGVPCFIVDNTYVVQGAQPTSLWERVIDEIAENRRAGAGGATEGGTC